VKKTVYPGQGVLAKEKSTLGGKWEDLGVMVGADEPYA
jgi:hypothetical protein